MPSEPWEDAASDGSAGSLGPRSHFLARTPSGRFAVVAFLVLLALAQPPFVHAFANRIEPRLLGMPFLYVYLGVIYIAMIGVLLWSRRRGL